MADPAHQRLFFALWPASQQSSAIARAAKSLSIHSGRRLTAEQLHVTLAFLGAADADRFKCYCTIAEAVRAHAFTLQLDTWGHYARAQVVWLGTRTVPAALAALQHELVSQLAGHCGYSPEKREFMPHVTLWRKVRRCNLPGECRPVAWPVKDFVLAASTTRDTGAEYTVLRRWPLLAPQD